MMWRLLNKIFGWQYAIIVDCDDHHFRRMIPITNTAWMCSIIGKKVFIDSKGNYSGGYYMEHYVPLTSGLPKCGNRSYP